MTEIKNRFFLNMVYLNINAINNDALNYVVLRALWKIDVHLLSTLVNKSLYYYYAFFISM